MPEKKHRFKSVAGAVRRIRELEKMIAAMREHHRNTIKGLTQKARP